MKKGIIKFQIIGLILFVFTAITSFGQKINSNLSIVKFNVSKFGFSNVDGTFKGMGGTIVFDENQLASSYFNVCIDARTVLSDDEDRTEHLRDKDFFYVNKYPNICFKSSSIVKTANGYAVTGDLTIKGKSKKATIPFTFKNNVFKGTFKVNRKQYNLVDGTKTFLIGDMVDVTIICTVQ
ncbi:MAG TPA: YceI family protein [Edaphocola sp.]|nr:YceI family protein [Edaphocola sp.]